MGRLQQRRERIRHLLKERKTRFLYPYGTKRTFNPLKWEWRDRILVIGELIAVLAAIAAIPVELSEWTYGPWFVIAATIIGTAALVWYAFDLVSIGETPLTSRMAHRIRTVVYAMEMEQQGVVFDWEGITEDGLIPQDIGNWSKLTPEGRANYKRLGADKGFLSTEHIRVHETTEARDKN